MYSILIGIPTSGNVSAKLVNWMMSFDRMGHDVEFMVSEFRPLPANRNLIRDTFLSKGFDYLVQLDDDIVLEKDFLKIIDNDKDICSAAVYTIKENGIIPLALNEVSDGEYLPVVKEGLFQCDAVGGGCVCIKRKVVEAVKWHYLNDEKVKSEDLYFCKQARENGFEVWYDANIRALHYTITPIG